MTESTKTDKEQLEDMRKACKESLYVFAQTVCGFDKFVKRLHKPMCNFMQRDTALRKMLLVPRDHYKSSVVQAYILWRLIINPEERILIVGDTGGTAEKKLIKIRDFIEYSTMLRALFPEIIPPDTSKVKWSTTEVTINRKGIHQEPSITAQGVSGARAGAHYTLIICDDVATKEAKDQPATMQKTIDWMDGSEALLELAYTHQILVVGTPWAHDDVYEHVRKSWGGGRKLEDGNYLFSEFTRGFFDEDGTPIFPELYADSDGANGLANAMDFALRMSETNPYLWSANFLLKPSMPNVDFDEEQLQYYTMSPDKKYISYGNEGGAERNIIPVANLQKYITCDPAFKKDMSANKAAINLSGIAPDGNIFILESIGIRGGADRIIDRIHSLCVEHPDVRKIGVELVSQQQGFIDYLNRELRNRNIYKRAEGLPPGSKLSKEGRIRALLQPYFAQRRIWVQVNMIGLLDEFRKFPLSKVRDELDAMAYAAGYYWKNVTGMSTSYDDYLKHYESQRATANPTTGY